MIILPSIQCDSSGGACTTNAEFIATILVVAVIYSLICVRLYIWLQEGRITLFHGRKFFGRIREEGIRLNLLHLAISVVMSAVPFIIFFT